MELSPSSENWGFEMCLSSAKTARTNVKTKGRPCLNEQQCEYLETELMRARGNIAEHMQVVTIFTIYKDSLK